MFGIPGLDGVGLIHSVFGIAALNRSIAGPPTLLRRGARSVCHHGLDLVDHRGLWRRVVWRESSHA